MIDNELRGMAAKLIDLCRAKKLKLVTAESCTGGLIAATLTEIPGASDVLERGFVTYSNAAKQKNLGVSATILRRHGAVSEEVAREMLEGCLRVMSADSGIAVTGRADPDRGLAFIALGRRDMPTQIEKMAFTGSRLEIIQQIVQQALEFAQ